MYGKFCHTLSTMNGNILFLLLNCHTFPAMNGNALSSSLFDIIMFSMNFFTYFLYFLELPIISGYKGVQYEDPYDLYFDMFASTLPFLISSKMLITKFGLPPTTGTLLVVVVQASVQR